MPKIRLQTVKQGKMLKDKSQVTNHQAITPLPTTKKKKISYKLRVYNWYFETVPWCYTRIAKSLIKTNQSLTPRQTDRQMDGEHMPIYGRANGIPRETTARITV